jgi:hypothetical protein
MNQLLSQISIAVFLLLMVTTPARSEWIRKNQSFQPINTHLPDPVPQQEPGSIAENLAVKSYPYRLHHIPRTGYSVSLPNIKYDIYKIFDPTLAKSVEVIGVVQTKNGTVMFYRSPKQSNISTAHVGEKILGGEVSIERIEIGRHANPIIVLKEDGIEVTRLIGEKTISPNQK